MRCNDRGSVTAEFAIVLPAVLAVLVLSLSAVLLAAQRIELASVAWQIATLEARGDAAEARQHTAQLNGATSMVREQDGRLWCVTLHRDGVLGAFSNGALGIKAVACAVKSEV